MKELRKNIFGKPILNDWENTDDDELIDLYDEYAEINHVYPYEYADFNPYQFNREQWVLLIKLSIEEKTTILDICEKYLGWSFKP